MYNAFEQRPADIYSILARLDAVSEHACLNCFPRVSGDVPFRPPLGHHDLMFSPRERGCSLIELRGTPNFPALGGGKSP